MDKRQIVVFYVLTLVVVVVGVDFFFLQHHFVERLLVNVGIVLVFASFYVTFIKRQ